MTERLCATPGCGRALPYPDQRFCRDCVGTVLRTSRPPVVPAWRRRIEDPEATGNTMNRLDRDETFWAGSSAA